MNTPAVEQRTRTVWFALPPVVITSRNVAHVLPKLAHESSAGTRLNAPSMTKAVKSPRAGVGWTFRVQTYCSNATHE